MTSKGDLDLAGQGIELPTNPHAPHRGDPRRPPDTAKEKVRPPEVLTIALQCAVPLNMLAMRKLSTAQRRDIGRAQTDMIAAHADDLLFGGEHCAAAFNATAKGLAALAYQPGGVTFMGLHWCAEPHLDCPHQPDAEQAPRQP